jgi:hypothetical protein
VPTSPYSFGLVTHIHREAQIRAREVDVINGAVVDCARQHGTEAPLNAAIVKLVHQFERGERKPSPDHYEEVLAAA